ncbi:MAG: PBP1A family penicillin-binding protein [Treponema sp.]|nr:PBP1A family penicillin-binding protein [Treponema sp.]
MSSRSSSILCGIVIRALAVLTVMLTMVIGAGLGLSLAETTNMRNQENFLEFAPALPTRILDVSGNVITEFAADETRTLVTVSELPRHLIDAILAREDPNFFNHRGFSVRAIARAAWGQMTGVNLGGGSTITQQIAGTLFLNRQEMTIRRKIWELWYAIQMERRFSKNEILEIYLNQINMGPGVFGVEAASQFFFGHSARYVTLAEAAILAILPSSPSRYNPLNNPNEAMNRQRFVLDRMIGFGFTTPEEAAASFDEFWANYDFTRASIAAYFLRTDAAPWFSEHVRRELSSLMYGTMDFHRDGFTVHTTLNMRHQEAAERLMAEGLARANTEFTRSAARPLEEAERTWRPIVDLLSLYFNLEQIHSTTDAQNQQRAVDRYNRILNPVLDLAAMMFGISELKPITNASFASLRTAAERSVVEGALVSLENETGHITALVGGSRFDQTNQFIRAVQANVQTGSAFKPLYFSAAIDSRRFTAASRVNDLPIVFHNEDGTPYIPLNFMGRWRGSVLLYDAMAQSMNVPAVQVLDAIGFDAAIDRSAALLGYTNPDVIRARFPRVFPLALGVNSTSPLNMARAFAIFGNQGREVTPIAIRSIEDRNGRVIMDLERDLRAEKRRRGNAIQVVSPQNAFIVSRMLQRTLERGPSGHGTLFNPSQWGSLFTFRDEAGRNFRMPVAGKTGTTQNWQDAWTVGYSAYFTTAVWFGFDRPGNSLGLTLTGSTLAGPIWANYMREIHLGLPFRDFARPGTGIVEVTVCTRSGLLRTADCTHGQTTLPFLEGTQPVLFCDYHGNTRAREIAIRHLELETMFVDTSSVLSNLSMPVIRDEQLQREMQEEQRRLQAAQNVRLTPAGPRSIAPSRPPTGLSGRNLSNPLLDDLPPVTFTMPEIPMPEISMPVLDEGALGLTADEPQHEEETPSTEPTPEETAEEAGIEAEFVVMPPLFNPLID